MKGDKFLDLIRYVKEWEDVARLGAFGDDTQYAGGVLVAQFIEGLSMMRFQEEMRNQKFKEIQPAITFACKLLKDKERQWTELSWFYEHRIRTGSGTTGTMAVGQRSGHAAGGPAAATVTGASKTISTASAAAKNCSLCHKAGHTVGEHKCGKCQQTGHGAKTCTSSPPAIATREKLATHESGHSMTGNPSVGRSPVASSTKAQKDIDRGARNCYRCHQPGHEAKVCPSNPKKE